MCGIFLAGAWQLPAAVFTIDPSQSQITLSGTFDGYTFSPQAAGSLTTSYEGNLNAAVSGSTIQFTGSSTVTAMVNGTWQPESGGAVGSAPADYGGEITVLFFVGGYGAARNLVMDLTSPILTLTGTNFDSSQLIMTLVTNSNPVMDYQSSALGESGSVALSGSATNAIATGSYVSTSSNVMQLVIQLQTTLTPTNGTAITLTGQIVATNVLPPVPPQIVRSAVVGGNFVITATNSTQSQLFISTNLTTWTMANFTAATNGGFILFTTPVSHAHAYFRVQ